MRYLFVYILVIFCISEITSQTISIKVINLPKGKAQLSYLRGENVIKVDSIAINEKGEFHYSFAKNAGHPGLYRLSFSNSKWIDFINDNEDVILITNANNISDSIAVISSESNRLYYNFIKLNKQYKIKTDLLQLMLAKYAKDDDYYNYTKNKLLQLQKEYLHFVNITSQKNLKSFIARYIKSVQLSTADVNRSEERRVGKECR